MLLAASGKELGRHVSDRVIDAYFGCESALRALTLELNDTPNSRLHSLLHTAIHNRHAPGLTMKHLVFLLHTAVLRCKSPVVLALSNILADMDVSVCDVPLLLLLIRRNNLDLMQDVLAHHFVSRDLPEQDHHSVLDALLADTIDASLAALVIRNFNLGRFVSSGLRSAVKHNDVPTCLQLVRFGAPLEAPAYITAAARGYAAICDLYIDAGFEDVRAQDNKALRLAASRGHLAVCRHIVYVALPRTAATRPGLSASLTSKGSVLRTSDTACRPLSLSQTTSIPLLHDLRAVNNEAFRWAAGNGHLEVCRLLLSCGLTLADVRDDDNNALRWAAGNGHLDVVRLLLEQGLQLTDLRARNNEAFRMAVGHGHLEIIHLLLACGLTTDDIRAHDNHALRWAAKNGRDDICQLLLNSRFANADHLTLDDIRACDNEAFRVAASFGHTAVCRLLKHRGLTLDDLRACDNEAFRSAAYYGHLDVCKLLIRWGLTRADAWAKEGEAYGWASKRGHRDMCAFLLSLDLLDDMQMSTAQMPDTSELEFIPL
jgi:ankyrin repeat protein